MANIATRDQLIQRVRQAADMINTQFVSDVEIIDWLNVGMSELHDLLVTEFEDYYESVYTFDTVVGQEDYSLPDDFYKLKGVDVQEDGNSYTLGRYMNRERNRFQSDVYGQAYWAKRYVYRLVGNVVRLQPTPQTVETLTAYYVPSYFPFSRATTQVLFTGTIAEGSNVITATSVPATTIPLGALLGSLVLTEPGKLPFVTVNSGAPNTLSLASTAIASGSPANFLVLTSTSVDQRIPQGWEEYGVLDAAIKAVVKEESDPSALMAQKAQLMARIRGAAADRDSGEPARVVDVTGRYLGGDVPTSWVGL